MDFATELLKQGITGLVAALFLWLYLQEKRDHDKTRQALTASFADRLADSKQNTTTVIAAAQGMVDGVKALSDKIEDAKERK
jgi:seryl-tRNA(Sec) selenium transferase